MTTSGMVRALVILVEMEYHPDSTHRNPVPNGTGYWQPGTLPSWVDGTDPTQNLFDAHEPVGDAQGLATRYFQLASSGNYTLLGDYLLAPDNGGVFKLFTSTGIFNTSKFGQLRDTINSQLTVLSGNTYHGYDDIDDLDRWVMGTSTTGIGLPKEQAHTEFPRKYDHVAVICLNCSYPWNRNGWAGSNIGSILGHGSNTYTVIGAHSRAPIEVFRHEFSHLLVGDNRFHCAGGGNTDGYPQYWISQSGGWAMMGLNSCSLLSWCGWDRQRMGWQDSLNSFLVSARDTALAEVTGDLDATATADTGIYVLRDFTLTGDALRIKLPYTDPDAEYPEFIWVENHQGYGSNGVPFDRWQYGHHDCVVDVAPGLYMYMQIDREVREGTTSTVVYPLNGYDDYLRPLIASGHHDIHVMEVDTPAPCVWTGMAPAFIRHLPNPLTGVGDTHSTPLDRNGDGKISRSGGDFIRNNVEHADGIFLDHGFSMGHARHGFRLGGNHKLGVGTNPSSSSMMNIVGENINTPGAKNHRRVQLNGVSVELVEQMVDGSIKLRVRFDDVDITNDARWCADTIALNPVPTTTGHSLNLTTGNTLLLDRGLTPTRRDSTLVFNGDTLFTSPTVLQCKDNTWFNLEPESEVVVDNGSTLLLQPGARLDVGADAMLRVKRGGRLVIMDGAELNVANGGRVIIEEGDTPADDGTLEYQAGAVLRLHGIASVVEVAGQLVIGDGAVFNIGSPASVAYTRGELWFTNSRVPSENITAGAGSRFIVRSDDQYRRILRVEQESLYGPDELEEFTLETATAELADYARIVPPLTNTCTIKFIDARVTSIGAPNTHRGLRLNGQRYVTLDNSRFERGMWGLYTYNTLLGHTPEVVDCRFEHCQTGMQSYGKGLEVTRGVFTNCVEGLNAIQVSDASVLEQCAATANSAGVTITGTAKLRVNDPAFNDNVVGLGVYGVTAFVNCGSISRNSSTGIAAGFDAVLHLDGSSIVPHAPVTVVDNGISIGLSDAERCYLNLGHNDLTPLVTGMGLTINGTYLCQPYGTQVARYNLWEGTPNSALTAAEYDVATNCATPVPVVFADPFGAAATLCGQANDPCPVPPCPVDPEEPGEPEEDALLACTTCRDVDTDSLGTVPLHVAALAAKLLETDEQAPDNERAALSLYTQILGNALPAPSADEAYIDGLNRHGLRDTYSAALAKGQLTALPGDSATAAFLAGMDAVLDARTAEALTLGLDDVRLAAALYQAQAHRGGGRMDHAVLLMDSILWWVPAAHQEMVERIACLTRMERDVASGTVHWDAVEGLVAACGGGAPKMMMTGGGQEGPVPLRSTVCSPGIHPVPLITTAVAEGFAGERTELVVYDVAGRPVWTTAFDGSVQVPGAPFGPGAYHYVMAGVDGARCTGRLVVAR